MMNLHKTKGSIMKKKMKQNTKKKSKLAVKSNVKAGFVVEDLQIAKTQQATIVTSDLQDW
jgi:CxxC motif-containing protein